MAASLHGDASIVQMLLDHRADVHQAKESGFTPLRAACGNGHVDVAELLLRSGAEATGSEGKAGLISACVNGHAGVVQLLLSHDVSLLEDPSDSTSPLMQACVANQREVAELLITHGADVAALLGAAEGQRPGSGLRRVVRSLKPVLQGPGTPGSGSLATEVPDERDLDALVNDIEQSGGQMTSAKAAPSGPSRQAKRVAQQKAWLADRRAAALERPGGSTRLQLTRDQAEIYSPVLKASAGNSDEDCQTDDTEDQEHVLEVEVEIEMEGSDPTAPRAARAVAAEEARPAPAGMTTHPACAGIDDAAAVTTHHHASCPQSHGGGKPLSTCTPAFPLAWPVATRRLLACDSPGTFYTVEVLCQEQQGGDCSSGLPREHPGHAHRNVDVLAARCRGWPVSELALIPLDAAEVAEVGRLESEGIACVSQSCPPARAPSPPESPPVSLPDRDAAEEYALWCAGVHQQFRAKAAACS